MVGTQTPNHGEGGTGPKNNLELPNTTKKWDQKTQGGRKIPNAPLKLRFNPSLKRKRLVEFEILHTEMPQKRRMGERGHQIKRGRGP